MTFNGVVAIILRYFTEFVYDVVVNQLLRFQNLRRKKRRVLVYLSDTSTHAPLFYHVQLIVSYCAKGKGKGFPYSTPSVGPGADPGVQAVSLQVTVKSSTRR